MMNRFTLVCLWLLLIMTQLFDMFKVSTEAEVQSSYLFIITLILLCGAHKEIK